MKVNQRLRTEGKSVKKPKYELEQKVRKGGQQQVSNSFYYHRKWTCSFSHNSHNLFRLVGIWFVDRRLSLSEREGGKKGWATGFGEVRRRGGGGGVGKKTEEFFAWFHRRVAGTDPWRSVVVFAMRKILLRGTLCEKRGGKGRARKEGREGIDRLMCNRRYVCVNGLGIKGRQKKPLLHTQKRQPLESLLLCLHFHHFMHQQSLLVCCCNSVG